MDNILNYGLDREKDKNEIIPRNVIIDLMLDSGMNYYVSDGKDSSNRENWYWNLTDNEGGRYSFLSEEKSELLKLFGKTSHDYTWPVKNATVTSAYGPRPRFVLDHKEIIDKVTGQIREGKPIYSKPKHDGIDITGNHDIISIEKGYVYKMNENSDTFGNNVFIYHGGGISSRYCHLASVSVREKQIIEKGSKIGVMGTTGHSTGIHLHFEIRSNYRGYKDPGTVLGTAGAGVLAPDVFVSGGTFKNKME